MNDCLGIINLAEHGPSLGALTEIRPSATVPFGGRYRLIDFVLSGLTNAGISEIGVLAPRQHRSLFDHVRKFDFQDTIFLLPSSFGFAGRDIDHLFLNADFLHKSAQEYVLMAGADVVGNFDFRELLHFHLKKRADITMLYKKEDVVEQDCERCLLLDVLPDHRVAGIRQTPAESGTDSFYCGIVVLGKELLLKILKESPSAGDNHSLTQRIGSGLDRWKVFACPHEGYVARIHCLGSYYRHNMALLNPLIWQDLFGQARPIHTKVRDDAPTKYYAEAKAANALVSGGCRIAGSVENSLLFRNVTIKKGAQIKESILLPNTEVGENACLDYVICDKDVIITAGQCLQGAKDRPIILKKGTVL